MNIFLMFALTLLSYLIGNHIGYGNGLMRSIEIQEAKKRKNK